MTAPFGRRLCGVAENQASGGYRIFSLLDREGQPTAMMNAGDCGMELAS